MKRWDRLIDRFATGKAVRRKPVTVEWYRQRLSHWAEFTTSRKLKPKKVKAKHLDKFFAGLREAGYTANTIKGTETALRTFFGWLVRRGKMKRNPFDRFEPVEVPRQSQPIIRLEYAYRMIRAAEADDSVIARRDAAIMRFLLSTGARREEVVSVRWEWLDLAGGLVKLRGKFGHERLIPLVATTVTALAIWIEARPASDWLFVSLKANQYNQVGDKLAVNTINKLLDRWKIAAGLPEEAEVNPHAWRRRFATELAKAGDPFRLQTLLGHLDMNTTKKYILDQPDILREMIERYGPGIKGDT
jgi:site-specific recombinase XerD